jgi:hypothetical protein
MRKRFLTLDQEKTVINEYVEKKLSTCKISKTFKTNSELIRNVLIRNNIKLRKNSENSKKYEIDDNFFNIVDTNDKAYFLGLLFADGNVDKKSFHVTISLKESDSYILEYFLNKIYKNKKLENIPSKEFYFKGKKTMSKPQKKLSLTNKRIGNDLMKYGLIPNKTHILNFPNIDKKFYNSFVLGYFDGDGCIFQSKKIKSNVLINFAGNEYFLNQLQDLFIEEIKLKKVKLSNTSNIFYLRYSGKNNIKKIHDFLYKDSEIFLKRKKEMFDKILIDNEYNKK